MDRKLALCDHEYVVGKRSQCSRNKSQLHRGAFIQIVRRDGPHDP